MDTKYLLLWIEAPLQSWGYDSKFNRRFTLDFPTKSGILGIVLCALGYSGEQIEFLERFHKLKQTVISYKLYKNGKSLSRVPMLRDFHMVGSGYDDTNPWEKLLIPKTSDGKSSVGGGSKLTHRYYLQDSVFSVILEVPSDLEEKIVFALQNPTYPIYFGRRCCIPSDFVYRASFKTFEEARNYALSIAVSKAQDKSSSGIDYSLKEDFMVVDGDIEDPGIYGGSNMDSFTINDVPLQFGPIKKYKDRRVTKVYFNE